MNPSPIILPPCPANGATLPASQRADCSVPQRPGGSSFIPAPEQTGTLTHAQRLADESPALDVYFPSSDGQAADDSGPSARASGMLPGGSNAPTAVPGHGAAEANSGTGSTAIVSAGSVQHETPTPPAPLPQKSEVGDQKSDISPLTSDLVALFEGTPCTPCPPDEWRIEEANRRLQILQTFARLVAGDEFINCAPLSRAKASLEVGTPYVTLWRWEKDFARHGFNGLLPKTDKCGRKSTFEKLGLTPEQVAQIRTEVQAINLDTNSVTAALRLYANSDRCPPALADVILNPNRCSKHALPPSLRAAATVTANERKAHRGPRALALEGIWTPRRMDVLPGDIFVADDTTPIWAWWVPWYESDEYPFGVKLLQGQFIPVMDVASQCIISYVIIAREKSSYRAADIWHLFGHTFEHVGLPRLGFQLERGSWEANIVRGQEVAYQEGEITLSRRVGGLRQMPTNISADRRAADERLKDFPSTLQTWTSYLPKTKSIEAFFNRSQSFEGTLWGCLGRDQMRAPNEKAKKQFQACTRKGKTCEDPRLHFLSFTEMCSRLNGMLNYVNSEPMEGEVFYGVPRLNFDTAVAERPLYQLPEELAYLYKRDWSVVTITSGWARVRLTHPISGQRYSLFYINPRRFAELEGQEVAVYYDRENFETPAQIISARTGEYLCAAQFEDRKGSFLEGDASGHDVRKQWRNAVMSAYGTLVKHAPSRQIPAEIAARRAEAKSVASVPSVLSTVDGRPAAVTPQPSRGTNPFAPATPEQLNKQQNRLARQAAHAARLTALE